MALYCSPDHQTSFKSIGLSVHEKKFNIDFYDGDHGGILGFPIRMILATSNLQVTSKLPMKFQVNLSFGSEEKVQNRLPTWLLGDHLEFLIRTILAVFELQVTPLLPIKFGVNLPFWSGEEVQNRFSRWRLWWPYWISDQNLSFFLIYRSSRYFLPSFESSGLSV